MAKYAIKINKNRREQNWAKAKTNSVAQHSGLWAGKR